MEKEEEEKEEEDHVAWVNAALGRVFWDFLSEPYWAELVSKKIQMKLSKIRVSGRRKALSFFKQWLKLKHANKRTS